jgi:chromosome partitioning protein
MLINYPEAASRTGRSERTIIRWVAEGRIPGYKNGRRRLVKWEELEAYVFGEGAAQPFPTIGPTRIIAVANQKGGVGKTTTAANLAACLAEDCRVLAIDMDPQGNLTQALGADPDRLTQTVYNVLVDEHSITTVLQNPIPQFPNLSLIGANLDLSTADMQLSSRIARETILRDALAPHLTDYDYIIIDCPPALGTLTVNALAAATEVMVPVAMGVFALRGLSKLLGVITSARRVNTGLGATWALSSIAEHTNVAKEVISELNEGFVALSPNNRVFKTRIRKSARIQEAQWKRMPIVLYAPNDPVAADYEALAKEIRNGV